MRRISRAAIGALFILLSPSSTAQEPPSLQLTDVVVAFGALQHAGLVYSQITICSIPGLQTSCAPLISPAIYFILGTEVARFNTELAKQEAPWKSVATDSLTRIEQQLDAPSRLRLAQYLALVRAQIG